MNICRDGCLNMLWRIFANEYGSVLIFHHTHSIYRLETNFNFVHKIFDNIYTSYELIDFSNLILFNEYICINRSLFWPKNIPIPNQTSSFVLLFLSLSRPFCWWLSVSYRIERRNSWIERRISMRWVTAARTQMMGTRIRCIRLVCNVQYRGWIVPEETRIV